MGVCECCLPQDASAPGDGGSGPGVDGSVSARTYFRGTFWGCGRRCETVCFVLSMMWEIVHVYTAMSTHEHSKCEQTTSCRASGPNFDARAGGAEFGKRRDYFPCKLPYA